MDPNKSYRNLLIFRTILVAVSNLISMQMGRIDLPFDWLVLLLGLLIQTPVVWGLLVAMVLLNLVVSAMFLLFGDIIALLQLAIQGVILWAVLQPGIQAYFHRGEGNS